MDDSIDRFDADRLEAWRQASIGDALAHAAFERGDKLTEDERGALAHWSMWGSAGYPVRKLGFKWTLDHAAVPNAPLYRTKREAVAAWCILIAKWIRLDALTKDAERRLA